MKIVTFYDLDSSLFEKSFSVEPFSNTSSDADVVIIGIDTIFDFEENKAKVCKDKFASIAVIEDESDYDAFKNFGIDAWIKVKDLSQINNIIKLVNQRLLK
jgi:hypothetical protein